MSDAFDPYYLWLGIPVGDQPPDHYRLLGIAQFESNADVIRNAAEQRMRYLRTVTGLRAKRAQQLINEIVTAQRVLSEDESREKYNTLITENPLARRRGVAPHAPQPLWEAARVAPPEGPEGVLLLPLGLIHVVYRSLTQRLEERREEAAARAEGRALGGRTRELVDRRLRVRLARPQDNVGEMRPVDRIREVLALEAEAGPFPVGDADGRRALGAVAPP